YCRADGFVTPAVMLDHSLALSLGGTNDESNLIASCAKCNSDKAKAEIAFIRRGHDPRDVYLDAGLRVWFDKVKRPT
ncbi:MAG: HNH endonuclease, partial [Alphaproteobacteria bacterium]